MREESIFTAPPKDGRALSWDVLGREPQDPWVGILWVESEP